MTDARLSESETDNLELKQRHRAMAAWMSGGLVAGCFACALTMYACNVHGLIASTSMRLFWLAIPTLLFNVLIAKEEDDSRYAFGWLSKLIPVCGATAAFLGVCGFVWSYDPFSSILFFIITGGCVLHIATAERHAEKKRAKKERKEAKALAKKLEKEKRLKVNVGEEDSPELASAHS